MGQILSVIVCCIKKCLFREDQQGRSKDPDNHCSLLISTPKCLFLDPLSNTCETETDSSFKLLQNVTTTSTCIDTGEANRQDSAYVLEVGNLEPIFTPEILDPLSDSETGKYSSFKLHQNVTTTSTCIDIVEENWWQDSAHVLDVDNWEEEEEETQWVKFFPSLSAAAALKNVCSVKTSREDHKNPDNHCSLLISTPKCLFLDPLSNACENETDSSFKLLQNVTTTSTCIDTGKANRQDSAYVLEVGNLEPIFTPEILGPLRDSETETYSSFKLHQNVTTTSTCIDIVEEKWWQHSAHVLDVDNWEEREVGAPQIRWIRYYCSSHKMLLVGEGDFSFSACLAKAFGSATNMVATSLDSRGFLFRNYKKAMANIDELRKMGCMVLHGVDATKMANHCSLQGIKFDRVIYNFPHAGFCTGESGKSQTGRNQLLISLFFKNAKEMIYENGEIHVTHKSNGFFLGWNLQGLASAVGLRLIQEVPFNFTDYPGYRTKYGFGGDKNFNCNPSKTYKFGLFPVIYR
ncbi:hypothetical protein REPUB_Repub05bG0005200 [Reevesia pubescens]